MSAKQIARYCHLDDQTERILKRAMERLRFSARAFHRVLKVARTIADLADSPEIEAIHLQEAVTYRSGDRVAPM
jgi:magnesium chelatase family protein